jgi:hypothetical protein
MPDMEATATVAQEVAVEIAPLALPAATPIVERPFVRATFLGLVFSMAFCSSFVIGFYWVGPAIESARHLM